MSQIYDCEIEGCTNKTDGFLCETHSNQAQNENMQIVVCDKCNKIIAIRRRKRKDKRYFFVRECILCESQTDQENPGLQ